MKLSKFAWLGFLIAALVLALFQGGAAAGPPEGQSRDVKIDSVHTKSTPISAVPPKKIYFDDHLHVAIEGSEPELYAPVSNWRRSGTIRVEGYDVGHSLTAVNPLTPTHVDQRPEARKIGPLVRPPLCSPGQRQTSLGFCISDHLPNYARMH